MLYFSQYTIIIPSPSELKETDGKCKEFLSDRSEEHRKVALVAWDRVCVPKKYGGLNIKNCKLWNIGVGKLLWQLAC